MKNKLYKILGAVLSVALVVTAIFCLPAVAENGADEVIVKDYYVMSTGFNGKGVSGDGRSADKPAPTVADVVKSINEDKLNENDIANVYIMQRTSYVNDAGETVTTAYNTWDTSNAVTNNGYYKHNMTAWTDYNTAPDEWNCKMVIKSPEGATNYLAYSQYLGIGANLTVSGNAVFENVIITCMSNNTQNPIITNDHDVEFSESTKFTSTNTNGKATSWSLYDGNTNNRWMPISLTETDGTYSKQVNLNLKSKYLLKTASTQRLERIGLMLASYYARTTVFSEDVNIVIDNNATEMQFTFGGNYAASNATFNKNLNINVKDATTLIVNNGGNSNDGNTGSITVNGGLQMIYPSDVTTGLRKLRADLTTDEVTGTSFVNEFAKKGVTKYWLIQRVSDNADIIDFVKDANGDAIAGKFKIQLGYTATATDNKGNTYNSKDGVLNLSDVPGAYTVTFTKGAVTKDYYVKSMGYQALNEGKYSTEADAINGSGNSAYEIGTKENPAATVADAIRVINKDGLGKGDTANIYIMQNDNYNEYDGSEFGKVSSTEYRIPYHNMTSWVHTPKNDRSTVTPDAYECNLVVRPYPESNTKPVYLAYSSTFPNNCNLVLNGPTVFDGVTLLSTRTVDMYIMAQGNDITLTDGTKFAVIEHRYTNALTTWDGKISGKDGLKINAYDDNITDKDGINITINNRYRSGSKYFTFVGGKTTEAIKGDVNLTVDNSEAIIPLTWGSTSDVTLTNVNVNIKSAEEIRNFNNTKPLTINGGLQIIVNSTVNWNTTKLTSDIATIAKDENGNEKYWFITNGTQNKDVISFCVDENSNSVLGKYIVADGYNVVAVNNTTGESIWSSNGELDLRSKPGTYTITSKEAETHNYDEYINYRNGLGNTYSKLNKDKELNVVYFGGSVTAGSGASDANVYSWRARIGNWLTTTFPTANVTNIKQAIGETGTYLGCYRVARDVVSKAPDLLFIEYSINDYYDGNNYDRSQMQFETIVRQVKAKYPNCDIVTILVTSYGNINLARQNKLHTAAQAHEDICNKYNIPSIYVGGALAESFGETWTKQDGYKSDATWLEYIKDDVHPTDKGYEIYFNVIKEFLNNQLNYGEYDGTVKVNPMPEIQNNYKYLFDGDITYIDESTVAFTTEGGTTYNPESEGIVSKEDYQGLIFVPAGSKDTITVNFTGTELIMVTTGGHAKTVEITTTDSAYTENDDINKDKDGIQISVRNTFEVSLDGGKTWTTNYYAGKNPIVIAAGLSAGSHTAVIRPSSYAQTRIAGFYSRDVEKSSNILNILDLVNADEQITASTTKSYFDYNNDDVIDVKDLATLKKILLNK